MTPTVDRATSSPLVGALRPSLFLRERGLADDAS